MKAKWIRIGIGRKVDEWLESIDDETVRKIAERNVIVTGGCIVSMLLGEKVNDYDIYFRTRDACVAVAGYYVKKFKENPPTSFKNDPSKVAAISLNTSSDRIKIVIKSAGIASEEGADSYQYFEGVDDGGEALADFIDQAIPAAEETVHEDKHRGKYRPTFLSANAITLSNRVQLIIRFFGEPEVIHKTYDFVHCTCYWDSGDRVLHLPPAALESILARDLRYLSQSKYPICAMIRTRKFIKRGWNVTAGQLFKVAWDISKLKLDDYEVLEDQLIGVDSAYFAQVLALLREKDPNKIDAAYLMEVIDKVF